MTATCDICGDDVALSHAAHTTINTKTDAGVVDYYVCRGCYEADLAPLFD
ncbi:hypothetical protein [Halobacterium sp. CBA1126]|nr:hypothetical protein [Halobacterium sp. CBA1126]